MEDLNDAYFRFRDGLDGMSTQERSRQLDLWMVNLKHVTGDIRRQGVQGHLEACGLIKEEEQEHVEQEEQNNQEQRDTQS